MAKRIQIENSYRQEYDEETTIKKGKRQKRTNRQRDRLKNQSEQRPLAEEEK